MSELVDAALDDDETKFSALIECHATLKREWLNVAPPTCDHAGWSFERHGRACWKCHEFIVDFGD